jgi:hypothetical protein
MTRKWSGKTLADHRGDCIPFLSWFVGCRLRYGQQNRQQLRGLPCAARNWRPTELAMRYVVCWPHV